MNRSRITRLAGSFTVLFVAVFALRPAAASQRESLDSVRAQITARVAHVQTLSCTLEMSKKREKKKTRKVKTGPLELARGYGARLALTRKDETDEYIANPQIIWSYEHHEKEAVFIPTDTPLIGSFVQEAMKLNVFAAVDEDTARLRGSQAVDGIDCWVLEGKSPTKLRVLGLPVTTIRVWIAKHDGVPRKIQLPDEDETMIILRNVQVNPEVSPSRFQWQAPADVKTSNIFGF